MSILSKAYSHLANNLKRIQTEIIKASKRKIDGQHQLTSTTSYDRYPQIFQFVKSQTTNDKINVLSFGCSTGEECFSIREYFPEAKIIGADINLYNLKKASKKNYDSKIRFIKSEAYLLKSNGPYDIIFAMSVLCRWEDTKDLENCESIYSFEKFESTINDLYTILKHGGLLVVYNANFKVEDTIISKFLESVISEEIKESGFVHKFNKLNLRDFDKHRTVVYKKC